MTPLLVLGVAGIGAVGAVCRYGADAGIKKLEKRFGLDFPLATMCINVVGSFLLGVITALVLFRGAPSELRILLGVGFCSSFTTFSTAVLEAVNLLREGRNRAAFVNAAGTVVLTLCAAWIGLLLGGM